jgi:hypothetical protein
MSNTIDSALQRDLLLLGQPLTAFARVLMPLTGFSTVYDGVKLDGTDIVEVPFYDLDATASAAYNAGTGYAFNSNTATSYKEITVNKRLFQDIHYSSAELRRQPAFDPVKLLTLKTNKLGADVLVDVLSVITVGNFSNEFNVPPLALDSDHLAELRTTACQLNWPDIGRTLVLSPEAVSSLLSDPDIKSAAAIGGSDVVREGILPNIFGWHIIESNYAPTGCYGFACVSPAVLVAFSPVTPTEAVLKQLRSYNIIGAGTNGPMFEHRVWGTALVDSSYETIECNYGYAAGNPNALIRLTE